MSDPITTLQMTLSRVIDDQGELSVRVGLPDTYSAVEILGLLEVAKMYIYREMENRQ